MVYFRSFLPPPPRGAHLEQDGTQAGQENSRTQARRARGPQPRHARLRQSSRRTRGIRRAPARAKAPARHKPAASSRPAARPAVGKTAVTRPAAPARVAAKPSAGTKPGVPLKVAAAPAAVDPKLNSVAPGSQGRQVGKGRRREARDPSAAHHARGSPVAVEAADRARQGAGLPDLRRSQRSPAVRDRRSGADRRHRADDQRHGHPGVREGAGCRGAAAARAGGGRR